MNVRIKKIAAVILSTLLAFAATFVSYAQDDNREDWKAKYIIQNDSYDSDAKTYTAEVYLSTSEYLSEGTFGLAYDAAIMPEFTLNGTLFEDVRHYGEDEQPYIAVSWHRKDVGYLKQEVLLGTIKVDNVEWDSDNNIPKDWNMNTLRQLEWRTTATAQLPEYNDEFGGITLNREVWRDFEGEEREYFVSEYGVTGCYQGLWWPELDGVPNEWVDIWFEWRSNFDLPEQEGQTIKGTVQSYNPNEKVTVRLLRQDEVIKEVQPENPSGADCIVDCSYEFTEVPVGEYTLEVKKTVHLTYRTTITVGEELEQTVPKIKLYCGDISGDEQIKLNDRSTLMLYLNKRLHDSNNETAMRCDLNGDGKITFHDLDILKIYYNKSYGGEA